MALPLPAYIPDPYMPDVHQRLYFYKRYAQASTDEELEEIRAEIVDRCGDPPDEVDALGEVMKLKVRLRALRIRALETGPGRIILTLGEGAALDPFLLARAVQGSGGAWRLTPDMKLVARVGPPPAAGPGAGPPRPPGPRPDRQEAGGGQAAARRSPPRRRRRSTAGPCCWRPGSCSTALGRCARPE